MLHITWIRHGSTLWNKEQRSQGHSDNPLDEDGIRQAEAVAVRLAESSWDAVYSSDLLRARQTAEIVASRLHAPPNEIIVDARLRELKGGLIEGTTLEERVRKWGEDWRSLDLGIEAPEAAKERGRRFVNDMLKLPAKRILVISHGAIVRHTLMGLIDGQDDRFEVKLNNTSVTQTVKESGDAPWRCLLYNCTKHLEIG